MAVAITGVGAVSALGTGVDALERRLLNGESGITGHPDYRSDPAFPVAAVDIRTSIEEDRARRHAVLAAKEALEDAGWSPVDVASPRTMLVVATTKAGLNVAERAMERRVAAEHVEQAFLFALAPRLAEALGMTGPRHTVSLACASGIVAVGLARQALLRGDADRALVVGADALCNFIFRGFATLQALDPAGSRPFDARRAGLTVGEGAAAVALDRGDGPVLTLGYGASNDANHITGPARDGRGLVAALEQSLAEAEVPPANVGFAVLHGTGTRYNDAMEGVAYAKVFGERALPALSIKGAVGHTMGAAGLMNLVVAVRGLLSNRVPPSVGMSSPDLDIPLDVVSGEPRSVSSSWAVTSASGFAGVNAAVVIGRSHPSGLAPGREGGSVRVASGADKANVSLVTGFARLEGDRAAAVDRIGARAARRLDDLCLFGVAAAESLLSQVGLSPETFAAEPHGLVLGTALGCLESDYGFYVRELDPERYDPSPRLFAYTLPNIVLGEAAIRYRWPGENVVLSAGRVSGLAALLEADRRIKTGVWARALVLSVDAVGPAAEKLTIEASPVATAWLLEREDIAAGAADGYGTLDGQVQGAPVGDLAAFESPAEPLGSAGMETLASLVLGRQSGAVEVTCPSGYAAAVEWRAKGSG